MPLIRSQVQPLAGIPTLELRHQALLALIEPLLSSGLEIVDGPILASDAAPEQLRTVLAERPSFTAKGADRAEAAVTWIKVVGTGVTMTGSLTTYVERSEADGDALVAPVVRATQLLGAPFGFVEAADAGFRDRSNRHRDLYQEGRTGADRVFGLARGFSGLPWRTVLGPDSVRFFGRDRLQSIPPELGRSIDADHWLLTPCSRLDEWSADAWCPGEAALIEMLGHERFFDPSTGRLPDQTPDLPDCARIPITARRRDDATGEWIWEHHNGYRSQDDTFTDLR